MTVRPPESEPPDEVVYLVWLVRLAALVLLPPVLAAVAGLSVRIFRLAAGVE